jgi:hypothetical protein
MPVDLAQALASVNTTGTGLLTPQRRPAEAGIGLINRAQQIPGPAPTRPVMSNRERLTRLILSEAGGEGEIGSCSTWFRPK